MHIVTLGELLVDMFPAEMGKSLAEVTAFLPKPGGAPANVAVAAKRLGAESAFIGKVGDDAFGHHLVDVLDQEGVDTRAVRYDDEARTTMAVIAMPDENTAEFVFYRNPGADQRLRPDELDEDLLRATRAFHFGSLSLTDEPVRSATSEAVRITGEAGALVSYDVNYRPALWADPSDALKAAQNMLPYVNLVKVNEVELALLIGRDEVDVADEAALAQAAGELRAQGPELVVVTLGRHGSLFECEAGSGFVPPFEVQTVDATGCGDAFIAGLLSQLTAEEDWRSLLAPGPLRDALRYANAVGALTSTTQGVIPALPTNRRVEAFLASRQ